MKSETYNDAFQPVKLLLESQAEVDAIFAVLNNSRVRVALELPLESYRALLPSVDKGNTHRLHLKLVDLTTKPQDAPQPQWIYFINRGNNRPYRISTVWTSEQPAQVTEDGEGWTNSSFTVQEVTGAYANRFRKLDDLPIKSSIDIRHLVPEKTVAPYVYFAKSSLGTSTPGIYRFPVNADSTDFSERWDRNLRGWVESVWRVSKMKRFATKFFPISEDKAQGFLK